MSASRQFGPTTLNDEVVDAFSDRVKGRVFLVTGPAHNGLGDATLRALARGHPSTLLLAGRTPASYAPVVDAIKSIDSSIIVRVYVIDLNSFASVRAGATKILHKNDRLDVVINSAGVMRSDLNDEARVVNVSSGAYVLGSGDYSDVNFKTRDFDAFVAYSQSKLANVLFSQALAKRGITSYALHPGIIRGTSLQRDMPPEAIEGLFAGAKARGFVFKELNQGASTALVAALDPDIKRSTGSGGVLEDCKIVETQGEGARKEGAAEELWKIGEKLVGQEFAV
ncbi:NAD(P)-binding protein [Exidia glandulosa HHB12029]|uniref:NAD(P)-binding protein n=1 Tax=Exidia glandulosa HHB12029 TaxID=1314781 RepID=A0A165FA44_EXIGL|nr:NAD(P)-binding protein [Exidia glandulosa HHB12029]